MKKLLLVIVSLFLFSSCGNIFYQSVLLKAPQEISSKELKKKDVGNIRESQGCRSVNGDKDDFSRRFTFGWRYENERAYDIYFELNFYEKFPKSLSKYKDRFVIEKEDDVENFVYRHGKIPSAKAQGKDEPEKEALKWISINSQIRVIPENNRSPHELSVEECAAFIAHKKVLFVTGAGISIAAKIPTLQVLYEKLGADQEKEVDSFVIDVLENQEKLKTVIRDFRKSIYDAKPTPAHYALKRLAFYKGSQIVTDNYDGLHNKSGIREYKINYAKLEKDLTKKVAEQIDGIIVIGSSMDFKALLGRYKKFNPLGVIIAINKEKTKYLDTNDFIVKGDIQKILPAISKIVVGSKKYNHDHKHEGFGCCDGFH
jgi:NAD-dependent SIR2 family protein deacetylase